MDTAEVDIGELVDRVARLERQIRFWKFGGLLAILTFAFSLAVGVRAQQNPAAPGPAAQTPAPAAQRIVAQDFQLRDASGTLRGELTVANGQPKLDLYNAAGKVVWSTNPRFVVQGN